MPSEGGTSRAHFELSGEVDRPRSGGTLERVDPVIVRALGVAANLSNGDRNSPRRVYQSRNAHCLTKRRSSASVAASPCRYTMRAGRSRRSRSPRTNADQRSSAASIKIGHVLQLMAMYFHAHAQRRLTPNRVVDGVALSPRELECLEWAAQGKSAWEIGRLLNVSRRTAAFHLDNTKTKFGVRTICQAVAKLVAAKSTSE